MNWNLLAAWLDKDKTPDYTRLAAHKIGTVYVDPNSANAAAVIVDLEAHGLCAGIYECDPHQWGAKYTNATPQQFAQIVSDDIKRLIQLKPSVRPVMLNIEGMGIAWTDAMVMAYRVLRPTRPTSYADSAFQDGTVVPIATLIAANFHWYPECFSSNMTPIDPGAIVLEIGRWGFPAAQTHPFYSAANLPSGIRDGCCFTATELP